MNIQDIYLMRFVDTTCDYNNTQLYLYSVQRTTGNYTNSQRMFQHSNIHLKKKHILQIIIIQNLYQGRYALTENAIWRKTVQTFSKCF